MCNNVEENGGRWFCIRIMSGKETVVVDGLNAYFANAENQSICLSEVFVPSLLQKRRDRSGREVSYRKKYCPGYVFIHLSPVEGCPLPKLGEYEEVIFSAVRKGGGDAFSYTAKVHPLKKSEIDAFKRSVESKENEEKNSVDEFLVGDSVEVISGPFSTCTGVVENVDYTKGKLYIAISVLGRSTKLEVGLSMVKRISSSDC